MNYLNLLIPTQICKMIKLTKINLSIKKCKWEEKNYSNAFEFVYTWYHSKNNNDLYIWLQLKGL